MITFLILAGIAIVLGYIRLAPSDPAQWHVEPQVTADKDLAGGVLRSVETGPDGLARLDQVATATDRTQVLAGSVDSGMVTYVTRTKVIGFPDYTTAMQDGETLKIFARLRFGRSDMGVNRARIDGWLAAIKP